MYAKYLLSPIEWDGLPDIYYPLIIVSLEQEEKFHNSQLKRRVQA